MDETINTAIDAGIDQVVALFTTNLPLVFTVVASLIGLGLAWKLIQNFILGTSFTSWAWLDRMTYKPYKGYNRWRSRKWNMEHTAN
jgi:hypothetical protein